MAAVFSNLRHPRESGDPFCGRQQPMDSRFRGNDDAGIRAPRTLVMLQGHGLALCSACHTRCGVAGMSRYFTPDPASASCTAFMSAAGAPIAPASPQPLAPSGLCVHGVTLVDTLNDGRSSDRGMA